jgi:predicted nucleic acid-binding protein
MSTVFVDTVGLLALWDRADQWHAAAREAFDRLKATQTQLVTTPFILLECGNAAARRPYRVEVNLLRKRMEQRGELIVPTDDEWQLAWQAYARWDFKGAGIVDQLSFLVMRRLGLSRAFTNDEHFRAAGFETLF